MPRKVLSLDGDDWELGQAMQWQGLDDVTRWIGARVPGNVRADLLRAGLIEDPFPAKQNELSRWVEDWNWWYRREFKPAPGGKRFFLRFEGIDYHSHIFFNGRKVAENEGMFAPVIVEITELLRKNNTICVNVEYAGQFDRMETLKCQMGFGWDFAPAMRTMGIWDSVSAIQTGEVFIRNMGVEPVKVTEDYWEARVTLEIDSSIETGVDAGFTISPENFDGPAVKFSRKMRVPEGISRKVVNIPVNNPEL